MDCREAQILLHADIDDELDAANAIRLEAHLAGCTSCTAARAAFLELKDEVRAQATRHALPAALRTSIEAMVGADQQAKPGVVAARPAAKLAPGWRRLLREKVPAFAAGAALAASLAVLVQRTMVGDAATDSVVSAHVRALQPGHLTDIAVSDRHQVKPWFDGKLDFAPPVKDLGEHGFELVGGRLDSVEGRTAAVVVYRRRLHLIDLFVTRGQPSAGFAQGAGPNGYNVEHWTRDGLDYWAVSDLNKDELADFAQSWRQQ